MLRLSADEVSAIKDMEARKAILRRKAEVRNQSKELSKRILSSRQEYRQNLLDEVKKEIVYQVEGNKEAEVRNLCERIKDSVEAIGFAHKAAELEPNYEEIRSQQAQKFRRIASQRVKVAAKAVEDVKSQIEQERQKLPRIRREVRSLEDLRAAHLVCKFRESGKNNKAEQPLVAPVEPVLVFDQKNLHQFQTYRLQNLVSKIPKTENARQKAEEAEYEMEEQRRKAELYENRRKAKQRGKQAIKSEVVKRQYLEMMEAISKVELEPEWDIGIGEYEKKKPEKKLPPSSFLPSASKDECTERSFSPKGVEPSFEPEKSPEVPTEKAPESRPASPDFTQPFMIEISPPKKVFDGVYLCHATSLLEELTKKRRDLEEEFKRIPREVESCLQEIDIERNREQELMREDLSENRNGEEQVVEDIDGVLNESNESRVKRLAELKKDFRRQDAFERVQDSMSKKKDLRGVESLSSTGSTSYMELPSKLTKKNEEGGLLGSSNSTEYRSLPEKFTVTPATLMNALTQRELTALVKSVVERRK